MEYSATTRLYWFDIFILFLSLNSPIIKKLINKYNPSQIFYFAGQTGVGDAPDLITLTHADETTTTGHHVQTVAKALAKILNAAPHAGGSTITAVDLTNSVYAEGLTGITGVAITIDS